MNKEEILERSRRENNNQDIYEKDIIIRASSVAIKVGMLLCCTLAIFEIIFKNRINYSSWTIFFGILTTMFLVKYHKLRRKHEIMVAILYFLLCLICLSFYIVEIVR